MKIIKFGATWCNGCTVMRPRWGQIEKEYPWLQTEFYDYDINKDMVEKYKVGDEIPVAIFLDKNGQEITRITGEIDKSQIVDLINANKDR